MPKDVCPRCEEESYIVDAPLIRVKKHQISPYGGKDWRWKPEPGEYLRYVVLAERPNYTFANYQVKEVEGDEITLFAPESEDYPRMCYQCFWGHICGFDIKHLSRYINIPPELTFNPQNTWQRPKWTEQQEPA